MQSCSPSMVLIHHPAEKLFIDFAGHTLTITDPHTGQLTHCQVFIACLTYSDYVFAMGVQPKLLEVFIHALVCLLIYLGGLTWALVHDRLNTGDLYYRRHATDCHRA